eukprot:4594109-Amphidinium_carterae.1
MMIKKNKRRTVYKAEVCLCVCVTAQDLAEESAASRSKPSKGDPSKASTTAEIIDMNAFQQQLGFQ